ncbi:hypothetical protein Ocin01_10452 [Orchesella cincta]|uniref:Uncharacterized protein n=1 Tax=Orchesella cincta TaxID=48709 RepID=A0A1D2MTK3_ORCCI|nr:hypothetical protein Ocin01_10452 [Orchesella cincta]
MKFCIFKMANILALFGWTFMNVQIAVSTPASLRSPRMDVTIHLDQLVQNKSIPDLKIALKNISSTIIRKRQDDTGLGNVAEIVSGVLGGGLGSIFEGSSAFIGDAGVQEEVQFVLNNVAPSFDVVLKYGWEGLKRYFGIGVTTTQRPLVVVVQQPNQTVAQAIASATLQPVTVTEPTEEDPESKNDNVDYPLLSRSRVG